MTSRTSFSIAAEPNTIVTIQPDDERRAWATQGAQLTELIQNLYSIVLYDLENDQTLVSPGLDPAGRTSNAEYFFRVPPKTHEISEPFATTIQGTQGGGKYVESYGSIIKGIKVAGTTGLRPNKSRSAQSIPLLGVSDAQLNTALGGGLNTNQRNIPADEKTGWDDIIFLRNIFRRYSDVKSSDFFAGRVVMLWRNLKDADYWVVEPEDFRLAQNSSSPLTYEYNISLKTLARFDYTYVIPVDPLEAARTRQRMLARMQEYGQNLTNILMTISTQINRFQGYAVFITNTVLAPLLNVLNGLSAIRTSAYGVVRGLRVQVQTLGENIDTAIANFIRQPGDPLRTSKVNIVDPQDPVIRAMRRMKIVCARILSEPVATESVADIGPLLDRYANAYYTPGSFTTPRRSPPDSPSYVGHEAATRDVGSGIVAPGEDIRDVASRLLGDSSRWRILVALNHLHSPYIAASGGYGVLGPGDTILFPRTGAATGAPGAPGIVGTQNPTSNETLGQNGDDPITQAYGRDLMLRSTFIGGDEFTDVAVNQGGDLASIQGVPNVEQAIRIKFLTERGQLAAHPRFGIKFLIGRKATAASFNEFRINTINTLTSDNRIVSVKGLHYVAVGDKLAAQVDVELINARDVLSTNLALRRF